MVLIKFEQPYISDLREFYKKLDEEGNLSGAVIQNIDFSQEEIAWQNFGLDQTLFLGCIFHSSNEEQLLRDRGAIIFPFLDHLPYNPYRRGLYSWEELMAQEAGGITVDQDIYEHFYKGRYNPDIREALSQRIHDHAIEHALREMLGYDDVGMTREKCVGFMGGHSTLRTDEYFTKTAITAQMLGAKGYFIVSGGGPGIMEAANLGGYFAGKSRRNLLDAVDILSKAPHYTDDGYLEAAREVLDKYPGGERNLAIPTWFYGHEPSNLFASHIAKLFSNSIREDSLLAICLYGVVFAPGSAGTTQEIFQDAAQNHYGTFGYYSPMVFMGEQRYQIDTLIYPLLRQLAWDRKYKELLFLSDSPQEIMDFILENPPMRKE